MKNVIARIKITQANDFIDPRMEKIIMRSSLKNRMTRMTLATRTTLTTRATRSTEMFPRTSLCGPPSMIRCSRLSAMPKVTTKMSRTFHHTSWPRKKSVRPSQNQRRPNSMLKSTVNATCNAMKPPGECICTGVPLRASATDREAMNCVCQPMNTAFRRMSVPLTTSYLRLMMKRWSGDCAPLVTLMLTVKSSEGCMELFFFFFFLLACATLLTSSSGFRKPCACMLSMHTTEWGPTSDVKLRRSSSTEPARLPPARGPDSSATEGPCRQELSDRRPCKESRVSHQAAAVGACSD
mmetsp:Transcript_81507/g.253022  ORF Transcript_81507/g.253022 Transcript_81507/m.253022 type:complete len:295 (-) Transcript_81507:279-1163(-)